MLFSWVLFLLIFLQRIGNKLGIPYLFLDPEYLHRVDFLSFSLLGFSLGLFSLVFQITSYILYAARFPFFAFLKRPFLVFSVNNSLFPLLFHLFFAYGLVSFRHEQATGLLFPLIHLSGYLVGLLLVALVFGLYFYLAGEGPADKLTLKIDKSLRKTIFAKVRSLTRWREAIKEKGKKRHFLTLCLSIRNTDQYPTDYEKKELLRVFDKNHLNVLLVGLLLVFFILLLGKLADNSYLQLPVAVTFSCLFTLFFMLITAGYYWLGEWHVLCLLTLFFCLGFFAESFKFFSPHHALGISYDRMQPYYTEHVNKSILTHMEKDKRRTRGLLQNWHAKFPGRENPPLVVLCVSGGGLCASLFTFRALQAMDSLLERSIMYYTTLITGASGGMLGAAYYRSLYHKAIQGAAIDLGHERWVEDLAKDKLNPVMLSLLTHDMFSFFGSTTNYEGGAYAKDRGYAWEEKVNRDTRGLLDRTIGDYKLPEYRAEIPMMLLAPTIVNNGTALYISPQGVSYMPYIQRTYGSTPLHAGVDFSSFFEENQSASLRFLTALRMNATFPYIMPYVALPTTPPMQIMDAGMHDNSGIQDALKFLHTFESWLETHVSGVLFLVVRGNPGGDAWEGRDLSASSWLTEPITLLYDNIPSIQSTANRFQLAAWRSRVDFPVQFVYFFYEGPGTSSGAADKEGDIALSWHLTRAEKQKIRRSIGSTNNQKQLEKLTHLLEGVSTKPMKEE